MQRDGAALAAAAGEAPDAAMDEAEVSAHGDDPLHGADPWRRAGVPREPSPAPSDASSEAPPWALAFMQRFDAFEHRVASAQQENTRVLRGELAAVEARTRSHTDGLFEQAAADNQQRLDQFAARLADLERKQQEPPTKKRAASAEPLERDIATGTGRPALPTRADAAEVNPCRIWLAGFPPNVAETRLRKFVAETVFPVLPRLGAGVKKVGARDLSRSVSLLFATADEASEALDAIRVKELVFNQRIGGALRVSEIRGRSDRTLEARIRGRVLGALWRALAPTVAKPPADARIHGKLGTNAGTGTIFIRTDEEAYELFQVRLGSKRQDGSYPVEVVPVLENLADIGMDAATAGTITKEAEQGETTS